MKRTLTEFQRAPFNKNERHGCERLTIGQVARRSGVNAKAIRYYESTGLLPSPQRSENGYRYYDQADLNRLLLLRRLRLLGVSLEMLKPLLHNPPDARCLEVQQEVVRLIGERLAAIDREMMELRSLRDQVQHYRQRLLACLSTSQETFDDCRDLSCLALPGEIPEEETLDVSTCCQ